MPTPRWLSLVLLLAAAVTPATRAADPRPAPATQPFELKDGDRVLLVGGTFMEREAQFGYIETMLTTRFPDRNVTFRNLGYAGDTVAAEARRVCQGWANFGGPDEGFNRLKKLVEEIRPTVVVAAYGMAESFAGDAGLPEFVQKYDRLLDMLTTAGGLPAGEVRVVLLSPTYHEDMGRPLPDPAGHNREIEKYAGAVKEIATRRGQYYVGLFESTKPIAFGVPRGNLTDNGLHLTPLGYTTVAQDIESALWRSRSARLVWGRDKIKSVEGLKAEGQQDGARLSVLITLDRLPSPDVQTSFMPISNTQLNPPVFAVFEPKPGKYKFAMGTRRQAGYQETAVDEEHLARGISLIDNQTNKQANRIRQLIVAKNADFFNYWRPENDTYILGYRKHEQGRNAVELPQFKPLVEAKEREIAKLRVPQPVTYTLEKQ